MALTISPWPTVLTLQTVEVKDTQLCALKLRPVFSRQEEVERINRGCIASGGRMKDSGTQVSCSIPTVKLLHLVGKTVSDPKRACEPSACPASGTPLSCREVFRTAPRAARTSMKVRRWGMGRGSRHGFLYRPTQEVRGSEGSLPVLTRRWGEDEMGVRSRPVNAGRSALMRCAARGPGLDMCHDGCRLLWPLDRHSSPLSRPIT
jgi:hypothetical protein